MFVWKELWAQSILRASSVRHDPSSCYSSPLFPLFSRPSVWTFPSYPLSSLINNPLLLEFHHFHLKFSSLLLLWQVTAFDVFIKQLRTFVTLDWLTEVQASISVPVNYLLTNLVCICGFLYIFIKSSFSIIFSWWSLLDFRSEPLNHFWKDIHLSQFCKGNSFFSFQKCKWMSYVFKSLGFRLRSDVLRRKNV